MTVWVVEHWYAHEGQSIVGVCPDKGEAWALARTLAEKLRKERERLRTAQNFTAACPNTAALLVGSLYWRETADGFARGDWEGVTVSEWRVAPASEWPADSQF